MEQETERLVSGTAVTGDAEEQAAEAALRPKRLAEFVGQPKVRDQLSLVLDAPRSRAASSTSESWSRPGCGARPRTTCCCPSRPGWARPRCR